MPKKYRLSHADFVRLPRGGTRRVSGTYFSLTVYPLVGSEAPKMASVVSKKIAARAVDRNRIERQCREALRAHLRRIKEPVALVFHGKREAASASFRETKKDIEALLVRAGI